MANPENLEGHSFKDMTASRQREIASQGGKASARARKERDILKETILARTSFDDWNEMVDNLIKRAKDCDKSFELLRDTSGQKPVEKTEVTNLEPPTPLSPRKKGK